MKEMEKKMERIVEKKLEEIEKMESAKGGKIFFVKF